MSNHIFKTSTTLINQGIKFSSSAQGKPEVITDYIPPLGDGKSTTPLELFLISLSACAGGAIASLLRNMGKTVTNFDISAHGQRRAEHPTSFEKITLYITLKSPDATLEDLQKAVAISEEKICPVWAMIKGNVIVETECSVIS